VRFALLAVVGGCTRIDEDNFAHRFAEVDCARHWQCDRGSYDQYYFGHFDCIREKERTYSELAAFQSEYGCTFDADAASLAYDDLHDMTCQTWTEGGILVGITDIWAECE
jgi:hypothetical protein